MGIKYLNKYLRNHCPDSIRSISIAELSGKKIAVDISIYLYKYETENILLENMYVLLSILRNYNVIPIFIFDGKAPTEKKTLIQQRINEKIDAENEYKFLKEKLNDNLTDEDKQDIIETMDQLKKKIVYITKDKIEKVKELIRSYGATYYDAPGEADELCSMLVINKTVWACLSEDMDMFVYGCTRVIRYFSLINHTAVLYYTKGILDELKLTQHEFRNVCVLSGTDYNITYANDNNMNLFAIMKYFKKYKEDKDNKDNKETINNNFYEWLTDVYPQLNIDILLLDKINKMFDININSKEHFHLNDYKKLKISNGPIQYESLKSILYDEGFIFI